MHINHWHSIKKNKIALAGLALLSLVILIALLGPVLTPHSPTSHSTAVLQPPSPTHWLGTNDVGQDILSRLIVGARTSLIVAAGVALLSSFFSLLVGAASALAGGLTDSILMRLTDALLCIPPAIVVILIASHLRPSIYLLILLLAGIGWCGGARIIRAQTLSLKERLHVSAAAAFGAGKCYRFIRHILPDLMSLVVVGIIQGARRAIIMEAGLSFLGITDPGTVSWGVMLHHALKFSYLDAWKWWLLPTGAVLTLTVLSLTYVGYALEELLDHRLKKNYGEVVST